MEFDCARRHFLGASVLFAGFAASSLPLAAKPTLTNQGNQYRLLQPPIQVPLSLIETGSGGITNLRAFAGKVILVNFWATWCVPCIAEMPELDRLQAELGGDDFQVVPLSIDEGGTEAVRTFYDRHKLTSLGIFHDTGGDASKALPLYGLPITYLVDRRSRARGYIMGATEWNDSEARRMIEWYLAE